MFLRDLGPTEVGGFGISAKDDLLLIEDICLVRQRCSSVTVQFDDVAVADFFDEMVDRGLPPERFARMGELLITVINGRMRWQRFGRGHSDESTGSTSATRRGRESRADVGLPDGWGLERWRPRGLPSGWGRDWWRRRGLPSGLGWEWRAGELAVSGCRQYEQTRVGLLFWSRTD